MPCVGHGVRRAPYLDACEHRDATTLPASCRAGQAAGRPARYCTTEWKREADKRLQPRAHRIPSCAARAFRGSPAPGSANYGPALSPFFARWHSPRRPVSPSQPASWFVWLDPSVDNGGRREDYYSCGAPVCGPPAGRVPQHCQMENGGATTWAQRRPKQVKCSAPRFFCTYHPAGCLLFCSANHFQPHPNWTSSISTTDRIIRFSFKL